MKKTLFLFMCVLLSGFVLHSCGGNDAVIQGELKSKLVISYPKVSCSVMNGIATLSGVVESEEDKTNAETMAKEVKDVKSVVNEIEVVVPTPKISPDESLKTAIVVTLEKAGYKDIGVEVKNEEVTLTGTVKKADQQKVLDVLKGIKTKKVINQMK